VSCISLARQAPIRDRDNTISSTQLREAKEKGKGRKPEEREEGDQRKEMGEREGEKEK
jgi:hypothetical protein